MPSAVLLMLLVSGFGGYAAFHLLAPKLSALLPKAGRVLAFKVIETSDRGPAHGAFLAAEVAPDAGSTDDIAATAVAIASIVPASTVIVSIERSDVAPSVDRWRRTLARVEYRRMEQTPMSVSTAEPLLSASEIAASLEYSGRAGLGLTNEGQPLSPEMDKALVKTLAAKHGVNEDRVTLIAPLHTERGDRTDWITLPGPGSRHVSDLANCYARETRGADEWKACT
jgi:hypothetical protein